MFTEMLKGFRIVFAGPPDFCLFGIEQMLHLPRDMIKAFVLLLRSVRRYLLMKVISELHPTKALLGIFSTP